MGQENRRKYFRIDLQTNPLNGEMTIIFFKGSKIELGSKNVEILDIGPGGLQMETSLDLPVRKDLILQFSTEILGEQLIFNGIVVWKKQLNKYKKAYGILFNIEENDQGKVTSILLKYQARKKKRW